MAGNRSLQYYIQRMSRIIGWSGYKWLTEERWGQIHENKPWMWYDESAVGTYGGTLELEVDSNPKDFLINGKTITSEWGVGLVTCETDFSFGVFEIEAKLPKGIGLWPAFWMWATDTWPPEVDIFEAYSEKSNYYKWFMKPYRIESCVHIKGNPVTSLNAISPWCWNTAVKPTEQFNNYRLLWTPSTLEFLINGKLVRRVDDKDVLAALAQHKMRVVINNAVDGHYIEECEPETPFVIRNFKYYSL
jgi:beta-glucanase (GH16 family)